MARISDNEEREITFLVETTRARSELPSTYLLLDDDDHLQKG